jgi:hypothetical protein
VAASPDRAPSDIFLFDYLRKTVWLIEGDSRGTDFNDPTELGLPTNNQLAVTDMKQMKNSSGQFRIMASITIHKSQFPSNLSQ